MLACDVNCVSWRCGDCGRRDCEPRCPGFQGIRCLWCRTLGCIGECRGPSSDGATERRVDTWLKGKKTQPKRVMPWVDVRTSDLEDDEYGSDYSLPLITAEEEEEYMRLHGITGPVLGRGSA